MVSIVKFEGLWDKLFLFILSYSYDNSAQECHPSKNIVVAWSPCTTTHNNNSGLLIFWERVLLCSLAYPCTWDSPASASLVLDLQV
jgi:hypothetical protein